MGGLKTLFTGPEKPEFPDNSKELARLKKEEEAAKDAKRTDQDILIRSRKARRQGLTGRFSLFTEGEAGISGKESLNA